jgi:hypothetical protein
VSEAQLCPDRLASLREAAGQMDEALQEEGFDQHGSHAVFVRWQRTSVETLGKILLEAERELGARVEKACAWMEESSRKFRDDEFRRAELLLDSGQATLNMAREAAQTATSASHRAEKDFDKSVARNAQEMSRKLLDESQQWLVLKQTERNRRDARRLASAVAAATLAVFVGGYVMAGWRQDKQAAEDRAVVEAVQRCWKNPITLRDAKNQPVELCRLQEIMPPTGQAAQSGG